jgi:hypothetical protein
MDPARKGRVHVSLPAWMHEPLLHFIVLGGLLFAIDHVVAGRREDPRTIVVGAQVDSEAIEQFHEVRGREPTDAELTALHQVWLDNEVLYREGLELGLDKGDDALRERVIFKALSVVDAGVKLPEIDDARLRSWFEQHRVRYDQPARFDFQEAALSGDSSESTVRSFVAALNAGAPGDAQAGLRVFTARPHANIVQSYGEDFAKALEQSPPGKWSALQTRDGWRAIQLVAATAAKPADYESLRGVVLQDWKDATAAEQRTAAVRALARKYTIRFEQAPAHGAGH